MTTTSRTHLVTAARSSNDRAVSRHAEVARLVALARDMLDGDDERIISDYLGHALGALRRIRESASAKKR